MKKNILLSLTLLLGLGLGLTSCEKDNYDEPEAGIQGTITDSTNGMPLETATAKSQMSMRITQTSWAKDETTTVTPQELNMKQDGTYFNDKLFAGTYTVVPWQGPFYPLSDDEVQTVQLKGGKVTTANFTVTPYLTIDWVQEPYYDTADGKIKCSVKFTRNGKDGFEKPDVANMQLYISTNQYVGPNAEARLTPAAIKITNDQEGQTIELESKIAVEYNNIYWFRVGANCSDTYKKNNYTSIKTLEITQVR